ncbi:tripartite tricarboxylate transporter TctB family protein [Roseibium sp. CAU 1637]|uniref:Tripartite tricarboxylate transporter TctB family protein n=1 Tax=Roseibium limicola TaxID=2816037 RepID=A0A939ETY7_9HYPH|nr:tripartite tricarboxylate transporter TctB family protein [Roseibium limicola]MBO0347044.1 tripartite tricarboxylate transporter TctB family protein [Roseibium limicola]
MRAIKIFWEEAMRVTDRTLGLVFVIAALIMGFMATRLPGGAPGNYGPDVFPILLSIFAILTGIGLIVRNSANQGTLKPLVRRVRLDWVRGAAVIASPIYAIVAMPTFGYSLTIFPVLVLLMAVFRCRLIIILPVAALCTIAIKYAFINVLSVPLPTATFLPF